MCNYLSPYVFEYFIYMCELRSCCSAYFFCVFAFVLCCFARSQDFFSHHIHLVLQGHLYCFYYYSMSMAFRANTFFFCCCRHLSLLLNGVSCAASCEMSEKVFEKVFTRRQQRNGLNFLESFKFP